MDGGWKNDKKNGEGFVKGPEGDYECYWRDGDVEGYGTFWSPDGDVEEVNVINNSFTGTSLFINAAGEKFEREYN